MKNIFKIFLSVLLVASFGSCADSNNVIDQVTAGTTSGAVLRLISTNSNTLNSSIATTEWSVTLEEQDGEDGGLFESVEVYVSIKDLTPANGVTVANDILVKSIPASSFTTGPVGLPRGTVSVTFGEAEAAMGLNATTHAPGDLFVFETRLKLTDGRVFGAADAGSSITGGFFASAYKYNALLLCSPKDGVYKVEMHDSYGDGWQTDSGSGGSGIKVKIDGVITEVGFCSPYGGAAGTFLETGAGTGCVVGNGTTDATAFVTIPAGTLEATWDFPGDQYGEIFFEVYAPDGSLLFASGNAGDLSAGLIPVVLCL